MLKAEIDLKVTGVRGNETYSQNKGSVVVFVNDDTLLTDNFLEVDAFEEDNDHFKRRERTLVTVHYMGKEWQGSFLELVNKLKLSE